MSTSRRSKPTADKAVTFLICCIRHTDGGKVQWASVAAETGVTSNAVYKRYKKLIESYDVSTAVTGNAGGSRDPPVPASKAKGISKGKGKKVANKGKGSARGAAGAEQEAKAAQDDEKGEDHDQAEDKKDLKVETAMVKGEPSMVKDEYFPDDYGSGEHA